MTTWLDVTTTRGWHRPALGIVRVEAETARQFLDRRDPGIRFCWFDLERGAYLEVSPEELGFVLERIDAGGVHPSSVAVPAPVSPAAAAPLPVPAPWQPRWKRVAFAVVARLPAPARAPLLDFARSRREAVRNARLAWRHARAAAAVAWRGGAPVAAPAPIAAAPAGCARPARPSFSPRARRCGRPRRRSAPSPRAGRTAPDAPPRVVLALD